MENKARMINYRAIYKSNIFGFQGEELRRADTLNYPTHLKVRIALANISMGEMQHN